MNRILRRLKKIDFLVLLVSLLLLLFIITIVLFNRRNRSENINNGEVINNLNNSNSQQGVSTLPSLQLPAKPNEYPESEDLLESLPYYSNDFNVDYLPLERGSKPNIIVKLISPNSAQLFKNWLSQFKYDENELVIEYISNEPLHTPYNPSNQI